MVKSEVSAKKIDSCKKIFELMYLILDRDASFQDIVELFSKEKSSAHTENNLTLYSVELSKYINTLKLFGFNVSKEKGHYRLINSPYKIDLSNHDLHAFDLIKRYAKSFKNTQEKYLENCDENERKRFQKVYKVTKAFDKFLENLEFRFTDSIKVIQKRNSGKQELDFGFYFVSLKDKICICSNFCKEDYDVNIVYYNKNSKILTLIASPKEIIYGTRSVRLKVMDKNGEYFLISLDKIIDIKQQPYKSKQPFSDGKTSVYGIRGRLSQNYKLREWETLSGYDNGWMVIVNKKEPEEELFKRLLKYADSCKIFTPITLKQKFLAQIDEMLKMYQDT